MHKISRILTMNSTFSRVVGQCSLHGLSASRCQLKLSLLNPTAVRHNKSLHDEPKRPTCKAQTAPVCFTWSLAQAHMSTPHPVENQLHCNTTWV